MPARATAARFASVLGLGAWALGVQGFEGLASAGLGLTVAGGALATSDYRSLLRQWWPLGAFLGWALLAPTLAGHPPNGSGAARTLDWLALPFAAAAWSALPSRDRWRLGGCAAGWMVLSCLAAGLQHFGAWPAEESLVPLKWTQLPFARVYEPVPGAPGRFMGGGLLFHRLKFAHVTSLGVIAALVAGAQASGGKRRAAWALAAIGGASIWLFPFARMAAVAMTAAVALTVIRVSSRPARARLIVLGLGVVVMAIVSFSPALRERFATSFTAEGSGERVALLETGVRAVEEHPWTGIGPGQFRPAKFADASTPEMVSDNAGKAHEQLLSIAAETGIPGAALFLLLLVWVARRGWSSPLVVGALAFFALLSLAHDPLFQAPFSMALVGILGVGLAERRPSVP